MSVGHRIAEKLTSGQFILTVACAFVFAWVSVNQLMPPEAVASILTAVFVHYFKRDRHQQETHNANTSDMPGR